MTPDTKWVVVSAATLISFLSQMPMEIKTLQFLVFVIIIADTVTGVIRAAICKKLSSHKLRTELLSKTGCYFGFVILGGVAGILGKTWLPFQAAYVAIMATEATSIIENIVVCAKVANLNIGPASRFLDMVAGIFAAYHEAVDEKIRAESLKSPDQNIATPPQSTPVP